jgi:hypothetical protein
MDAPAGHKSKVPEEDAILLGVLADHEYQNGMIELPEEDDG